MMRCLALLTVACVLPAMALHGTVVLGQESSLFKVEPPRQGDSRVQAVEDMPLPITASSWTYVPAPEVRQFQINDIVTIRVDELARMASRGDSQVRRSTLYDTLLRDWVRLDGLFSVKPSEQADGDPRIQGQNNNTFRANSTLESRESLAFNLAARIVDIRPNGHLVLEAHKTILNNEDMWETSLSGICRSDDIGPDNVVLSRDILDLQISKRERGQLRDGYRRGWLQKWGGIFQPF
jgi:flagellar L-ring protein FlgH